MFTCLAAGSRPVGNPCVSAVTRSKQQHQLKCKSRSNNLKPWVHTRSAELGHTSSSVMLWLKPRHNQGRQVYLFSITKWENVVRRGGPAVPLPGQTYEAERHLAFQSISTHHRVPKNALLARSSMKQCLPNLKMSHPYIQTFGLTQDE